MFDTLPTPDWAKVCDTSDFQHNYFITFGAFLGTNMGLLFDGDLASQIITKLSNLLLPPDDAEFLNKQYMPVLVGAIKNAKVSTKDWFGLSGALIGTLMKIGYAFLW